MREILAVIMIMVLLSFSTAHTLAAETTPSPSPSTAPTKKVGTDTLTKQITNLKERIASRVAELNLVEKRGIVGIASDVKGTEFTLTDLNGKTRFVDVDELTKFIASDSKSTFGISDIKKGMKIGVLGRYNKQSERLLARFVEVVSIPEYLTGKIKSLDEVNFSFVMTTSSGEERIVDVENITKTQSYSKEDGLTRAGFSRLANGDQVLVSGFPDKNDAKRLVATRVLFFLDFRKNVPTEASPSTTTPSTSRVSPTTKVTPTP